MKTMLVPVKEPVECGIPIPNDWNTWISGEFREIREIEDKVPFANYSARKVSGESLKASGVHNGDWLICRETSRYVPGKIGVWRTSDGLTAKYAAIDNDGFIILHNHNGWKRKWSSEDIKLVEVVVRLERDFE
jgi:SOS-response transcriptional repressor LexA